MKKIFLFHCFPVPYRNYLFELLNKELKSINIDFQVLFYEKFNRSRPTWNFISNELNYNNRVFIPLFKYKAILHLNLDLILYVFKNKPNLIILGGTWSSINSIFFILLTSFKIIGWDETNRYDKSSKLIVIKRFKYLISKNVKYFALPGKESFLFYNELLGNAKLSTKKILNLPNIVNENILNELLLCKNEIRNDIMKKYHYIDWSKKIIYWPARYIHDKGIQNYLSALSNNVLENVQILLVGHGPLKAEIHDLILQYNYTNIVHMLDSIEYDESLKFYMVADMLIMPSLSDSNPLSLVEAIHCKLPILVSNRVGNLNEVLISGYNGYSLDPYDKDDIYSKSNYFFNLSKHTLQQLGLNSKEIAIKNYSSIKIVKQLVTEFKSII